MRIEDGMRQEFGGTGDGRRDVGQGVIFVERGGDHIGPGGLAEDGEDVDDVFLGSCLVDADADTKSGVMEVHPAGGCRGTDGGYVFYPHADGIEIVFVR